MQTIYAKTRLRVQGIGAHRERIALLNLAGGLLFADVADANGGRIAVFCRDGLAVLELCELPATYAAADTGPVRRGSGQA